MNQYNIPHANHLEAIGRKIISVEPVFTINGVDYHKMINLSAITANRYLQYQGMLQDFNNLGTSKDEAMTYIDDVLDLLEEIRTNEDDTQMVVKRASDAITMLSTFKFVQESVDPLVLMVNMCSFIYVTKSENPYVEDFAMNDFKIKEFTAALASDRGEEVSDFFTKHFSQTEFSLMRQLIDLNSPTDSSPESQRKRKVQQDLFLLRLLEDNKRLTVFKETKHIQKRALELRASLMLLRVKFKGLVS